MTAAVLQEKLCDEISLIFADDCFSDSSGERVKMNVFEQELPIRESDEDADPVPYIIVRVEQGTTKSGNDAQEVLVTILIGYFDDNLKHNGHKGVLGIIQKIHERFEKNPMLAHMFIFQDPFDWALQDEDSYPYYFGAISMTFRTAAIRKEDRYA